jgi:hypothetical protein
MSTLGEGQNCWLFPGGITGLAVSDTSPHVATSSRLKHSKIVTYQLIANGTLDGSWKIEVSNDFCDAGGGDGQAPTLGAEHWTDITAGFTTSTGATIPTVAHGTVATQNIPIQAAPLGFRAIRLTFTATAGSGNIQVIISGGGY